MTQIVELNPGEMVHVGPNEILVVGDYKIVHTGKTVMVSRLTAQERE